MPTSGRTVIDLDLRRLTTIGPEEVAVDALCSESNWPVYVHCLTVRIAPVWLLANFECSTNAGRQIEHMPRCSSMGFTRSSMTSMKRGKISSSRRAESDETRILHLER